MKAKKNVFQKSSGGARMYLTKRNPISITEERFRFLSKETEYAEKIGRCAEKNCARDGCPIAGQHYYCQDCSLNDTASN